MRDEDSLHKLSNSGQPFGVASRGNALQFPVTPLDEPGPMKVSGITYAQIVTLRSEGVDSWLSAEESRQFEELGEFKTNDWLAGRIALKNAYVNFAGRDRLTPTAVVVRNGATGFPYIGESGYLYCSLSHSDGWGIGAVSSAPVGVDIERVRDRDKALLPYIARDEELAEFDDCDADALVTKVWTIKESAMKLWRKGLGIHPKCVVLRRSSANTFSVGCMTAHPLLPRANVRLYEAGDFVISVASTGEGYEAGTIRWVELPGVSTSR